MEYERYGAKRLSGEEPITDENENKVATMKDFWSWAYSNTVDNAQRGVFAEYLVASALGISDGLRVNWDKVDLKLPDGITVEVKSSGYLQNWEQKKESLIGFGIQPTYGWDSTTNTNSKVMARQADIYCFCVHKHKEKETANPLDISQWEFFLLPTKVLNEKLGNQKTAMLSTLISIGAKKCEFGEIRERVYELLKP